MSTIMKIDENGSVVGRHDLSDHLVEAGTDIGLVHQVVVSELAGHRQGTAAAKSRGMVIGSGRKPWRQKGTGRARAGTAGSPVWVGGGVAFPPVPRSYHQKINKKVRARAYRMALGDLVEGGSVRVLAESPFEQPSTKRAAAIVRKSTLQLPLLVLVGADEVAVLKSFRNLPGTRALPVGQAEVQDYVWARSALLTEAAVSFLEAGSGRTIERERDGGDD